VSLQICARSITKNLLFSLDFDVAFVSPNKEIMLIPLDIDTEVPLPMLFTNQRVRVSTRKAAADKSRMFFVMRVVSPRVKFGILVSPNEARHAP